MKPGQPAYIRIGRDRRLVLGTLESIDLAAGKAVVIVGRTSFARDLKRVYPDDKVTRRKLWREIQRGKRLEEKARVRLQGRGLGVMMSID